MTASSMIEAPGITPGVWRSVYTYESAGRGHLADDREVTLMLSGSRAWVASLPGDPSRLEIDLAVRGRLLTGIWEERTDPAGYYAGRVFTGAVQFILAADSRSMAGCWVGHSRDLTEVNTGTWTLTYAGERVDEGGV